MMNIHEASLQLLSVLMPETLRRVQAKRTEGSAFVHYTSAEKAVSLIRNREVWLRMPTLMNDYSETRYGLDLLDRALRSQAGDRFTGFMNSIYPGFLAEFQHKFRQHGEVLFTDTYIACVSEHTQSDEPLGRLSMWRAYGGSAGVALVLNPMPFLEPAPEFPAFTSPVQYINSGRFTSNFFETVGRLDAYTPLIRELGRQFVLDVVARAFISAVLCTKHPGFAEEREWRVIYCKSFGETNLIKSDIVTISGIPQKIRKIPLKESNPPVIRGIEIKDFVQKIIIGPSAHAAEIEQAICVVLEEAGIQNPKERIVYSGIPLRA